MNEDREFTIEYITINSIPHEEIERYLKEFLEILDLDYEPPIAEDCTLHGFSRTDSITLDAKWYDGYVNTFILKCNGLRDDLIIFRKKLEEELRTYFDDTILVSNEIGQNYDIECYEYLHNLENNLRKMIIFYLAKNYGKNWWDQRIPSDIKDDHGDKKGTRSKKIEEMGIKEHDAEDMHEIFYADFSDLKKIIERKDNWREVFKDIFKRKGVLVKLDELYPLRNRIAHNRYLTKENTDTIRLHSKKLHRYLSLQKI